jgi:hypothetical protein
LGKNLEQQRNPSQAGLGTNVREPTNEMAQRRRGGEKDGVQTDIVVVGVQKGVLEEGFGGKWLCSITRIYTYLHVFTRIYTILHNVLWLTLRAAKSRASRQDLPIRELLLRSSHSRGATFRRLVSPCVAFSDGEGWKKVPRTGFNADPELRETMWISLAGHERIIIKIRIAIKRLFSQSAVDTWPTFATLGPSIFATQSPINGAMNRN